MLHNLLYSFIIVGSYYLSLVSMLPLRPHISSKRVMCYFCPASNFLIPAPRQRTGLFTTSALLFKKKQKQQNLNGLF